MAARDASAWEQFLLNINKSALIGLASPTGMTTCCGAGATSPPSDGPPSVLQSAVTMPIKNFFPSSLAPTRSSHYLDSIHERDTVVYPRLRVIRTNWA
jgi:hypothetical protein